MTFESLGTGPQKKYICPNCGFIGAPGEHKWGCLIAVLLWVAGAISFWLFGLFVGALVCLGALAYTIYQFIPQPNFCPKCGTKNMVPEDTPRGKELIEKYGPSQMEGGK